MADIRLVRIDYRLVHGQIIAAWLKASGSDRIVVVNDALAADEFMTDIYALTAQTAGASLDVMSISAAPQKLNGHDLGDGRFLVLFKSAQDALAAEEAGLALDDVQVGGLGGGDGSVGAYGIAFKADDVEALRKLDEAGVNVHLHVVPTDSDVPFSEFISKLPF